MCPVVHHYSPLQATTHGSFVVSDYGFKALLREAMLDISSMIPLFDTLAHILLHFKIIVAQGGSVHLYSGSTSLNHTYQHNVNPTKNTNILNPNYPHTQFMWFSYVDFCFNAKLMPKCLLAQFEQILWR